MKDQNSLTDLIRIFYKWRKTIISITLAALVTSVVVSFLLPNYYKSTEVFYPYSFEALNPKNLIQEEVTITDVFGNNSDVERLKQIAQSGQFIYFMVTKFDLYKRYEIDPNSKYGPYYVGEEFKSNYKVIKNEADALELTIFDKDPNVAAAMVNEGVRFIDSCNRSSIIYAEGNTINILRKSIEEEIAEVTGVKQGVKEAFSINEKNLNTAAIIKSKTVDDIDMQLTERLVDLVELKQKYQKVYNYCAADFKTISIVEKATPAIKKAKPVRWLIVVSSTFLAFVLTLFFALLTEFYQNNIKEIIKDAK